MACHYANGKPEQLRKSWRWNNIAKTFPKLSMRIRSVGSIPAVVVLGLAVPDAEVLDAVGHVLLAL